MDNNMQRHLLTKKNEQQYKEIFTDRNKRTNLIIKFIRHIKERKNEEFNSILQLTYKNPKSSEFFHTLFVKVLLKAFCLFVKTSFVLCKKK